MDCVFKKWICDIDSYDIVSRGFCSSIGVVYKGIKPSEIINVTMNQYQNCTILRNYLSFKVISKRGNKLKLFVYNRDALNNTLNQKHVLKYLKSIGYNEEFHVDDYINTLVSKLKSSDDFPHEIGFFLGYPIKDVLGFMQIINLPHTKTMGWKMYGNTKLSEQIYNEVKQAKIEISDYMLQIQQPAV